MSSTADAGQPPAGRHPGEIPNYDVVQFIRAGGFGDVWLVRERLTDVRRAVKVLYKSDPQRAGRDIRGVQHYQRCAHNHPHLLQILTVGETERCYYYVMEAADEASSSTTHGYEPASLRGLIKQKGRFDPRVALQLTAKLLSGAACLHRQGLAHFDLKPDNVLIIEGEPKIADVGLVAAMETGSGRSGTPAYMTPQGRADDLYAIGKMLYEFVSGQTADDFPRLSPDILQQRSAQTAAAVQLVNRACHTDPARRFASVEEFGAAIEATVTASRGLRARWRGWPLGTRVGAACALVVLAVGLGMVGRFVLTHLTGSDGSEPRGGATLTSPPRVELGSPTDITPDRFLTSFNFDEERTSKQKPAPYAFLYVAGAPLPKPGWYGYELSNPIDNLVVDYHFRFERSWGGTLELGVAGDSGELLEEVRLGIAAQPDGRGLCIQFDGADGADQPFMPLHGHPQPGVEYVIRLARCENSISASVWPLARQSTKPVSREFPVPVRRFAAKRLVLSCGATDPLARVDLLGLRVYSASRPLDVHGVGEQLPEAVQQRIEEGHFHLVSGVVPPVRGDIPPEGTNLLAGPYHPYSSGAWMPIGNWSWWDNEPVIKGYRRVRCTPFSTQKRHGESADNYQGVQLLRFDHCCYSDFEARLRVRLLPETGEEYGSPLPCVSQDGCVGLAFRLQDDPSEDGAWGGGYLAMLCLAAPSQARDRKHANASVTRLRDMQLSGDLSFVVVSAREEELLRGQRLGDERPPDDDRSEDGRDRLLNDQDGFLLTLRAEGPRFTLSVNGFTIYTCHDPDPDYHTTGRIAIYSAKLIATFTSLEVKPLPSE